jgi:hypothetical protein
MERPTKIALRVNDRNPGHVRLSLFVGRNPGSRVHAGEIVVRTDEWDELRDRIERVRTMIDPGGPLTHYCAPEFDDAARPTAWVCEDDGQRFTDEATMREHRLRAMLLDLEDAVGPLVPDLIGTGDVPCATPSPT